MHAAICDDNVADRKQLERLLGRESDARKDTSGLLFFDSYGNEEAIFAHPMLYDVFFIDMCRTEGVRSLDIVTRLRQKGVNAPFVLCCGEVDYRTWGFPEGTLFLQKPIRREELRAMLDLAEQRRGSAEEMIELRDEENTHYLSESEILYAVEEKAYTLVQRTDGTTLPVYGSARSLFEGIESTHPSFVMPTRGVILNCRYIREFRFPGQAVMTDGRSFRIVRRTRRYAERMQAAYQEGAL